MRSLEIQLNVVLERRTRLEVHIIEPDVDTLVVQIPQGHRSLHESLTDDMEIIKTQIKAAQLDIRVTSAELSNQSLKLIPRQPKIPKNQ